MWPRVSLRIRGHRAELAHKAGPRPYFPLLVFAARNRAPHLGHTISSFPTLLISAGMITCPHFGQVVPSDAITFSRLTFGTARVSVAGNYPLTSRKGFVA